MNFLRKYVTFTLLVRYIGKRTYDAEEDFFMNYYDMAINGEGKTHMKKNKRIAGFIAMILVFILSGCKAAETSEGITTITFPSDNTGKTEFNASIYEVGPFTLSLKMPSDWSIESVAPNEGFTFLPVFSKSYILNENDEYVGVVGYNTYEVYEGAEEDPRAIYNEIALGNDYHFDVRDSYNVIKETPAGSAAVVDVYYSGSINDGVEKQNKGIVSYNKDLLVYVAMEFYRDKITHEQANMIAESISISK
ncbi:hypothetical protein Sgly_0961 [Syntrophobotulus glycolicus DSM 8271]|uniref:Uncharacterized protein n=2 Tax=Syntrophobotulus TaxID=51196 RepID=F0T2I4_SYNGF|nr:hypothetical protein Sgly_0961 [Syntrophobotulus glycolicus DSM 8271]